MHDLKERTLFWIHNHVDGIFLTAGTITGGAGISLFEVHQWLALILQLIGLFLFAMNVLMNYNKWIDKMKSIAHRIFGK